MNIYISNICDVCLVAQGNMSTLTVFYFPYPVDSIALLSITCPKIFHDYANTNYISPENTWSFL